MSPVVLFDARHGWRNLSSMETFFTERQTTVSARPWTSLPKVLPLSEKVITRLVTGTDQNAGKVMRIKSHRNGKAEHHEPFVFI